jgi:hypothetical protein
VIVGGEGPEAEVGLDVFWEDACVKHGLRRGREVVCLRGMCRGEVGLIRNQFMSSC